MPIWYSLIIGNSLVVKLNSAKLPSKHFIEILEEFNCVIQVGELVTETIYEYEQFFVHLETYLATIVKGTPQILEHAEAKWVPRQQLLKLSFAPADLPSIEKLLAEP